MRASRVLVAAVLSAGLAVPSFAAPECDLFLYSGVTVTQGLGPGFDPAALGCGLPGGPYDVSVLTPGATDVSGLVMRESTAMTPTHARIEFRDVLGGVLSSTPVTFRLLAERGYYTTEHVFIPPTAASAVIRARLDGVTRAHEYARLLPPS